MTAQRKRVTKTTRAGESGKPIYCPYCERLSIVHHFSWSSLMCQFCGTFNKKTEWYLEAQTPVKLTTEQ